MARIAAAGVLAVALNAAVGAAAHAADPNALWKIVHEQCVPDQRINNEPAPCAAVSLAGGEARGHILLKDLVGATQFLLIPTARVSGIESPAILAPDAPNYFAAAWAARFVAIDAAHAHLPPDAIGLAINSIYARSQNQLHIHIDCLRADVLAALRAHAAALGESWSVFPVALAGHTWLARWLDEAALGRENPFRLLADGVPGAAADMARETLVVASANGPAGRPGFVLLADAADPAAGDRGFGEGLQDHACAIAHARPARGAQ